MEFDAPAKKFQVLFAKEGYQLWHANQQHTTSIWHIMNVDDEVSF